MLLNLDEDADNLLKKIIIIQSIVAGNTNEGGEQNMEISYFININSNDTHSPAVL